jgi:hypothetical protein
MKNPVVPSPVLKQIDADTLTEILVIAGVLMETDGGCI